MILYCPATHKPNKYQQLPPVGGRGPAASPSRVASAQALPVPGGDRTCAQALPAGERAAVVGVGASGVEDRGVGDSAYAGGRPAGAGRRESRPPLLCRVPLGVCVPAGPVVVVWAVCDLVPLPAPFYPSRSPSDGTLPPPHF